MSSNGVYDKTFRALMLIDEPGAISGSSFLLGKDDILDVELFSEPCIQLADTDLDFGAQLLQRLDTLQQFTPKLLLRSFRELSAFVIANSNVWTIVPA
jgi:hypothetical protein